MLAHFVAIELAYRKRRGQYKGTFSVVCSFIGYQTRGALPSNFDATLAYNIGHAAAHLLAGGVTGICATVGNLRRPVAQWVPAGVPLTAMMQVVNGKDQQGHGGGVGSASGVGSGGAGGISGSLGASAQQSASGGSDGAVIIIPKARVDLFGPAYAAMADARATNAVRNNIMDETQ
jgi:hypothetical protein